MAISLIFCYPVADFGLGTLEIFWKINFNEAVGIHKNNLDSKGLKKIYCVHEMLLRKLLWNDFTSRQTVI
jgi:hypothetical protein